MNKDVLEIHIRCCQDLNVTLPSAPATIDATYLFNTELKSNPKRPGISEHSSHHTLKLIFPEKIH